MILTMILARIALWAFFIVPICIRLATHGHAASAVLAAAILGTLAQIVTALPEDD